jgi:Kef-type K+ transport system membrane component KefB
MIVAGILLFLLIRFFGMHLAAPASPGKELFGLAGSAVRPHPFRDLLRAMIVILIGSRLAGALFRYFHQPAVVGEILAGILLGPSLLGHLAPGAFAAIFPASVQPLLSVIANVGVVLFMFLVGLELNVSKLPARAHAALAISHASILCPFLLGSTLALILYPRLSTHDVPFTAFALFMGISMSVTAFPVLARILTDRRLQRTRMGAIVTTCAAVDDVTAWCLLAFVVGVIQARFSSALQTIVLTVVYILGMVLIARPLVRRLVVRYEQGEGSTQG